MGKWVAGIAGTVIAALLISWLTGAGGLFNRKRPDVKILSADAHCTQPPPGSSVLDRIASQRVVVGSVSVVNDGSASALQCQVKWIGVTGLLGVGAEATSAQFGLVAGERKTVDMHGSTLHGSQANSPPSLS